MLIKYIIIPITKPTNKIFDEKKENFQILLASHYSTYEKHINGNRPSISEKLKHGVVL